MPMLRRQKAFLALIAAFGDADAVAVTVRIAMINMWNRINVPFHVPPLLK